MVQVLIDNSCATQRSNLTSARQPKSKQVQSCTFHHKDVASTMCPHFGE